MKNGPNPSAGKLWLNFIMTDESQKIFAEGYVRPAVAGVALPASVADKMPPAPQIRPIDIAKATAKKADIDAGWAKAVLGQ